jgi:hypothetical protein
MLLRFFEIKQKIYLIFNLTNQTPPQKKSTYIENKQGLVMSIRRNKKKLKKNLRFRFLVIIKKKEILF